MKGKNLNNPVTFYIFAEKSHDGKQYALRQTEFVHKHA